MSIFSCARKNRALGWYRAQRGLRRRHILARRKSLLVTPFVSSIVGVTAHASNSAVASGDTMGKMEHPSLDCDKQIDLAAATAVAGDKGAEAQSDDKKEPTWRAMFLTFFAMIQPEWSKEVRTHASNARGTRILTMGMWYWQSMEVENDFLDDLRVRSVPPQVSDVVKSKDKGKICRVKACPLKRMACSRLSA